jgi:hypothetical protein
MSLHARFRRLVLGATLASLATLTAAGAAAAHECYNASRNARADANAATNSQAWMWASEVLVTFVIPEIVSDPDGLTPDQLAEALAIIEQQRAAGVDVYELDRALLGRATAASGAFGTAQSSDGRGIDHATENLEQFDPLIGHLIGVYMAVSS